MLGGGGFLSIFVEYADSDPDIYVNNHNEIKSINIYSSKLGGINLFEFLSLWELSR